MGSYGVGEAWEASGAGGEVTGVGEAVTGAAGAEAMTVDEDVPLAVTALLSRTMSEPLHPPVSRCCY